jgi:excisionase family DNA binding protein
MAVGVPEAAEMIGIGRSSLYALFREKKLTPRKSGKRTLILVEDLKHYVENLPAAS